MFEYDIPEDANPAKIYGTPEWERSRLARVPVPIRRAVDRLEVISPAEAKARFLAAHERLHPRKSVARFGVKMVVNEPVQEVDRTDSLTKEEAPPVLPAFWFRPCDDEEIPRDAERPRDWLIIEVRPKCEQIIREAAGYYNVSRADILSQRRTANVVKPRQIAMYLAKTLTLRSLPEIGRRFGGRDHTTVLHAVRKIDAMVAAGHETICVEIAALRERLGVKPGDAE